MKQDKGPQDKTVLELARYGTSYDTRGSFLSCLKASVLRRAVNITLIIQRHLYIRQKRRKFRRRVANKKHTHTHTVFTTT